MASRFIRSVIALSIKYRRPVLAVFILLLGLAAFRFHSLNLDTSIVSLFPDSSPRLARLGSLMEFNPGARVMFVELRLSSGTPEEAREKLGEVAELLHRKMGALLHEDLASSAGGFPAPEALLNIIPMLFDAEMERQVTPLLTESAIDARMAALRQGLSGPLAFLPKSYLKADPLGLLQVLRERFEPGGQGASLAALSTALNGERFPASPDGRSILLVLQPEVGLNDAYGAERFCNKLETTLAEARELYPGLTWTAVGGLSFTARNTATIERDLKFTLSLSIVLIALIYLFTVRSIGAVWLLLTPVAAVFFAGSVMSAIWPTTAGLALGFGAAVLGLAEDYAVLVHFGLRKNPGRKAEALARLARPMTYSALLCISGFCVLMLSSIPALRQMGFFASFSLLCGLTIAIFVLPACPWVDRPVIPPDLPEPQDSPGQPGSEQPASNGLTALVSRISRISKISKISRVNRVDAASPFNLVNPAGPANPANMAEPARLMKSNAQTESGIASTVASGAASGEFAEFSVALRLRPRLLPAGALAVFCLAVCVLGISRVPFDASFQNLGADSGRLQQEMHELRSRWQSGTEPRVWISSGSDLEEALRRAEELSARLRAGLEDAESKRVFSLADLLPPAERRAANIERWNDMTRLHPSLPVLLDETAARHGFRRGVFDGFGEWFAAGDAANADPVARLRAAGLGEALWWMMLDKGDETYVLSFDGTGRQMPDTDKEYFDRNVQLSASAVSDGLSQAFARERFLLPLAGVVCLLLLVLCFRRPSMVLLAALPPLFGLASVIGWLAVSGRPMTLPGAAALILVIGLGSDYGIVMLHELRSSFSLGAFKSILVSGLTTLAGLGVLILAEHPVLHTLGAITFFGLTAEMAAVLLIVPFLCTSRR